jgi:hypothetical protein
VCVCIQSEEGAGRRVSKHRDAGRRRRVCDCDSCVRACVCVCVCVCACVRARVRPTHRVHEAGHVVHHHEDQQHQPHQPDITCVCVCVCVCARVRARVRGKVCAHACVGACVWSSACPGDNASPHVRTHPTYARMYPPYPPTYARTHLKRLACREYWSHHITSGRSLKMRMMRKSLRTPGRGSIE